MVAPKNNAWGSDYWLARCLDGKQTLLEPVIDDEDNEFPVGSMVIKGEYLTLATQHKKEGWLCILGLQARSYCIPLHKLNSQYKYQVTYTFQKI